MLFFEVNLTQSKLNENLGLRCCGTWKVKAGESIIQGQLGLQVTRKTYLSEGGKEKEWKGKEGEGRRKRGEGGEGRPMADINAQLHNRVFKRIHMQQLLLYTKVIAL